MTTAAEIETTLGLTAGSVTVHTDDAGRTAVMVAGERIEAECARWSLRCVCTRKGFDAAIDAGIAALPENQRTAARAQWDHDGGKLSRSDILVRQIRGWIGYNHRQMDTLFAAAIAIEAAR